MTEAKQLQAKGIKGFFRRRQHPIKILQYIAKYLWLLLIPLAKYLIAKNFDLKDWIKTNWVDILTLSIIISYGFLRWVFIYFEIEEDSIIAHTGYFGIEKTQVFFSEMASMSLCQGYIYRFIGACTLYIDTDAKSIQNSDIRLDINSKQAFSIYELATKKCHNKPKYIFNSQKRNLVLFSLLFSSTLSGVLLTLTFIYEAYRIVGREIEEQFIEKLNTQLEKLTLHIPKYLLLVAAVVAGGWLVSFLSNLMRHWNFTCTRCADMLMISSGKGTKRRHVIMRERINYIDYQQSMLMKIFNICSVAVQCTGYGKRRLEISALVPITTNSRAESSVKLLMPNVPDVKYDVRTGKADLGRFLTLPLLFCFLTWKAYNSLKEFIPQIPDIDQIIPEWADNLKILAVLTLMPLLWLTVVKTAATFNTAIGFDNGHCILSYCKNYRFHRAVISLDRISKIIIRQNLLQRISGVCVLRIYTNAESARCHKIRSMKYKKLIKLLKENGLYTEPEQK